MENVLEQAEKAQRERVQHIINEGTFGERMDSLCYFFGHKSLSSLPTPLTDAQAKEVLSKLQETLSEKDWESVNKWVCWVAEANNYAQQIRYKVIAHRALRYSIKARIERYNALKLAEALAMEQIEHGATMEQAQAAIDKAMGFSTYASPYVVAPTTEGKYIVLFGEQTAAQIVDYIKADAYGLKQGLIGFKRVCEAFFNYLREIDMEPWAYGAYRFFLLYHEMVHGAFEAEIAPAYLAGTEPHETSPFPDIIPYYNEVKVPKKEQEAQDKVVKNIVDKVWKKRQRIMQKASE